MKKVHVRRIMLSPTGRDGLVRAGPDRRERVDDRCCTISAMAFAKRRAMVGRRYTGTWDWEIYWELGDMLGVRARLLGGIYGGRRRRHRETSPRYPLSISLSSSLSSLYLSLPVSLPLRRYWKPRLPTRYRHLEPLKKRIGIRNSNEHLAQHCQTARRIRFARPVIQRDNTKLTMPCIGHGKATETLELALRSTVPWTTGTAVVCQGQRWSCNRQSILKNLSSGRA